MKRTVLLSLVSLVVAPVLALTACSDDGGDTGGGAGSGTASGTSGSSDGSALPAFAVGPQGVVDDLTVASCDTGPGAVTASGTIDNSGKFARDLVVVITWVAPGSSRVLARGVATVEDVAPGASGQWTTDAELADGEGGSDGEAVACAPAAYAGQLE